MACGLLLSLLILTNGLLSSSLFNMTLEEFNSNAHASTSFSKQDYSFIDGSVITLPMISHKAEYNVNIDVDNAAKGCTRSGTTTAKL